MRVIDGDDGCCYEFVFIIVLMNRHESAPSDIAVVAQRRYDNKNKWRPVRRVLVGGERRQGSSTATLPSDQFGPPTPHASNGRGDPAVVGRPRVASHSSGTGQPHVGGGSQASSVRAVSGVSVPASACGSDTGASGAACASSGAAGPALARQDGKPDDYVRSLQDKYARKHQYRVLKS